MNAIQLISLIIMVFVVAGCSAGTARHTSKLPLPEENPSIDLGDHILKQNMTAFLKETNSPLHSQYEFSRLDLDSDGRRDALVLLKNPYGYWCGTHGCTLLVMQAGHNEFSLVNAIQPVRAPLRVSELKTNGWRNLITRISGRNHSAKDVSLQFNGNEYPQNPANLPPYAVLAENEHSVKIFP